MGLREKKKQANKLQIINSAEAIFIKQGYKNTTIEQIAENAEIGLGTIYNYFESKADLFIAVVMGKNVEFPLLNSLFSENHLKKTDPLRVLDELIRVSMQSIQNLPKDLWIEIIKANLSKRNDKEYLKGILLNYDQKIIENIESLFNFYKEKGLLADDFGEQQGAKCVYDIVVSETIVYLMQSSITLEECVENIQKIIYFIFKEKFKIL